MKRISVAAGALALILVLGCQESEPPATPGPVEAKPTAQDSKTATGARPVDNQSTTAAAPELMLISVRDDTVIAVIDFNSVRAKIAALAAAERRRFVLQNCFDCYLAERSDKHKKLKNVRIYAMYVPDRDEYAKANYANVVTLGIVNSTQERVADTGKRLEDRGGNIEWKSDVMKP